jgi:hypothetical protein
MTRASRSYSRSSSEVGTMMWPANLTTAYDYLHIEIVRFVPISQALSGGQFTTATSAFPTTIDKIGSLPGFRNLNASTNISNIQLRSGTDKFADIYLPVPEQLNYADQPKWSEQDIGAVNKMAPSVVKNLFEGNSSGAAESLQTLAAGGKIGKIKDILEKMGLGLNFNALTQGIGGKVMNPYTEQIFEGIGMRSFDMSWKLVPRSQFEQTKISDMIKRIRSLTLPNYSGSLGTAAAGQDTSEIDTLSDRWLEVPNIFRLTWKTTGGAEITSIPKIKPCVCTNVQVSYTPDNVWATHMINDQPHPVAYNLTMSFKETEIITGQDVANRGY